MKTTILALLLSVSLAVAGTPISFQQLSAGDSIHVTFSSRGCFHDETFEFDFQQAATFTAKVTQVEGRWNLPQNLQKEGKPRRRTSLGTVTLSEAEVAGLDRLFSFYRANKHGGCTTVDQISATQKRGSVVKATESFTDASCVTGDMKNLTRLTSIAAKLISKTK